MERVRNAFLVVTPENRRLPAPLKNATYFFETDLFLGDCTRSALSGSQSKYLANSAKKYASLKEMNDPSPDARWF